jgi:hypothetical protein
MRKIFSKGHIQSTVGDALTIDNIIELVSIFQTLMKLEDVQASKTFVLRQAMFLLFVWHVEISHTMMPPLHYSLHTIGKL